MSDGAVITKINDQVIDGPEALAAGMVAVSFVQGVRTDLSAYLFGDILSVTGTDLALIWGGAGTVAALIAWLYRNTRRAALT